MGGGRIHLELSPNPKKSQQFPAHSNFGGRQPGPGAPPNVSSRVNHDALCHCPSPEQEVTSEWEKGGSTAPYLGDSPLLRARNLAGMPYRGTPCLAQTAYGGPDPALDSSLSSDGDTRAVNNGRTSCEF